jgi:Dolichyl-phosphate-mannose-protein mannosyltransferase
MVANTLPPVGGIAQPSWSVDRMADRVAVAVLAIVAVAAALTFRDYGLGWDDYTHAQYGDLLLAFYRSGFTDQRAFSFVNLFMYGGGFDMVAALVAKVLPFDLFETRRLVGAVVGLVGLTVTWRIARRLGGPLAGLIALLLLATAPVFYGHMFFNAKDAPFAVVMTLLLLGLVRGCEEYPRLSVGTAVLIALGLGLSIGSRVMGALGVLYAIAALCLLAAVQVRAEGAHGAWKDLRVFLLRLVPIAVLAYAVMALVWPWSVIDPLNPFRALSYFSAFFEKPWREVFNGVPLMVYDMPRTYLPTLLGLKLPEVTLALSLLGAAGVLVAVARRASPRGWRAGLLVVLLAATFPIIVTVVQRPAMYNGIRHFVFLVPPIAILGGMGGAWLIAQAGRIGRLAMAAVGAAIAAGLTLTIVEIVRLHPYEYAYFNRIEGGIASADKDYMLDYWGLSFKQASQALRAWLAARGENPPADRPWRIAVCGPHPPAQVALGPRFKPTWDPKGADFAMMLGEYYCASFNAPVLAEVTREGVVFARVYDLRGRTVQNMFTIPPVEPDEKK